MGGNLKKLIGIYLGGTNKGKCLATFSIFKKNFSDLAYLLGLNLTKSLKATLKAINMG